MATAARGGLLIKPPLFPPFISRVAKKASSPKVYRLKYLSRHARLLCSCHEIESFLHISSSFVVDGFRDKFARRMSLAGLKPHHRIALAVSGGPDSIALCVLTAGWKTGHCDATSYGRSKFIDGLLAIVVDHGLRSESAEEANVVSDRITDMGIKCHVAHCNWPDGRPKLGHLQEEARNKRYEIFRDICIQEQIGILLIAHHADDQAELFILRLSRNSSVLGLAGMAFTSQMFSSFPDFSGEGSNHGILLVRPLLEFSKEDLYKICQKGNQQWVEDPTNRSQLYVRNRIRMSLNNLSSSLFQAELQAVILACRRTRMLVDKICGQLINLVVTVMPHGYVVIDLGALRSMEVKDIFLVKLFTLVLQFISQKQRPVRGNALKLVLSYLETFPCKTCLTVAGCYLCPAPGSKGSKVLVCCSINPSLPLQMDLLDTKFCEGKKSFVASELEQIQKDSQAYLYTASLRNTSDAPFIDATSSESVLIEAQRLGILSDASLKNIVSLQSEESEIFKSVVEVLPNDESKNDKKTAGGKQSEVISPGQRGYFMNRFLLYWKPYDIASGQCRCSCIVGDEMCGEVRHMVDLDWLYLSNLSKRITGPDCAHNQSGHKISCLEYAILSANQAIVALKSIPVAARRSLPVIVNTTGDLLSIPSIGFSHCPLLTISALFRPRIPLGGGYSSFL